MKKVVSIILSIQMIMMALFVFSTISFAQDEVMTIKPSRYGAWENWINSPNLMGDYESTTQLLIEAVDADGDPLVLPADAQWELTIKTASKSKTIKMNPATTLPSVNLYRFETCNGEGENKFVPVKGTNYTVSAKIYSAGTLIYKSNAVSGFTCPMNPIDPAVVMPEPAGTAGLTVTAQFDIIENYGNPKRTYFIVGVKASEANDTLYARLKNGKYKMYVTVTDETDKTVDTVYYPINKPAEEIYLTNFLRLALGEKGVELDKNHAYTLELNVYNQKGELKYAGKSATGIFKSKQAAYLADGPIIPSTLEGKKDSVLYQKSALFVGDSITEAICEVNIAATQMTAGWPGRIGVANDMYFVNKGLSGASVSDCRGSNTVLNQLKAMKNRTFDLLVMHGGVNDAWDSAAVGAMTAADNFNPDTFDQSTFAGGLEYMFWYAKTYYPEAVKGYIINFQLPGASVGRLADMSEYFDEAKKICDKWGIPYLDLYNNAELNKRMKGDTRYAMGDYIHPNDRGYDILYPYIEQFCECIMKGEDPSLLTDPAPIPEAGGKIDEGDVNLALGKPVKNGAGTTSYRLTDGSVDEYFMAGNWDAGDGKCYVELDLGAICSINKINVVTYVGNLLYQWEAYVSEDNTLSIDKWTKVGEMMDNKMSYEDGHTIVFESVDARYVRIYGIYDNASNAYVFNELSVYGEFNDSGIVTEIGKGNTAVLPGNLNTDKLTDGNKTSDPVVVTPLTGGSVTVDLKEVTKLSQIKVFTYSNLGAYQVYASVDGVNFVYVGEKAANVADAKYDAATGCSYVFPTSESYRYIKVVGIESARTDYCCALEEIEVYDENGNKITDVTAVAEKLTASSAANAIDGKYSNYCFMNRPSGNIVIDLGKLDDLRNVTVYPADISDNLLVQVSADNTNWITVGTIKAGADAAVACDFIGSYRYVRIAYTGANEYSIYEIEVYAVSEAADPSVEEELTDKEEVTITLGNGAAAPLLKDDNTTTNYTLIAEGDQCYALIDLQKTYSVTKAVIHALNGNYLFEIYGSVDGESWTKLAANEASASYSAAEGFALELTGDYRYIKVVGTACQFGYFTTYEMDIFGHEAVETPDEPDEPDVPDVPDVPDEPDVPALPSGDSAVDMFVVVAMCIIGMAIVIKKKKPCNV